MKIIHGMSEVAGQGINTVKGLRANGYDAVMAVWQKNKLADAPDFDLGVNKSKKYLLPVYAIKMATFAFNAMRKYDLVHVHFGNSLFPFGLDTFFYRLFKIKCFAEFHGSDIRFLFAPEYKYPHLQNENCDQDRKREKSRKIRLIKRAEGVILHDHELIPHLPDTETPLFIVPLRVDVNSIETAYPSLKKEHKPIIVHSPSKRSGKGTEQILKELEKVKGEFQLVLVENKSHNEAMEIYRCADIIIDQVSVGTYGVFAIEAMAMGKPVITYISPEMKEQLPESLPIISADFDELSDVVEHLIADPASRYEIGLKSRAYVERYHDNVKVAKCLYEVYDGTVKERNLFKVL